MAERSDYKPPAGQVGLTGPITRPEHGTLPLRGDLAHIALADRFLVAHYAVPSLRIIGSEKAALYCDAAKDSDVVIELDAGTPVETLDYAGAWCWACLGPDGPTGWLEARLLAD